MTKKTSVARNTRSKKTISNGISKRKDSRNLVVTWTKDETAQLINLALKKLKEVGSISFRQIEQLDWNQIHVDGKKTDECESHFKQLIDSRRGRNVRARDIILSYINIGKNGTVKLNPTSMLFCNDMRNNTIQKGKNILKEATAKCSEKEKGCDKFESKRESQKYRQITRTIIATPSMLYQEYYKLKSGELSKNKVKKFDSLANSEKLEWIRKAVNANKDGTEVNKILNKNELSIWRGEPKRPLTMRSLFIKIKRDEGMTYKTALKAFQQLNENDKDVYREMSRQAEMQYSIDLENFIGSLPQEEKGPYLTKLKALKRKKTGKSISASINSNDNMENLHEISENNTSNGVDSIDLVTSSREKAFNIDKEPSCTIEHISNFGKQKTSKAQSATFSSRVKDANLNKKPVRKRASIDQSSKSTSSFNNPSPGVDYELQPRQGKNSNSQKEKPNTNIGTECDSTTKELSIQSTPNTKTMSASKSTTMSNRSTPGYGNQETPKSHLTSSEQPNKTSIHGEKHEKTQSNLQKRKANNETTTVCKRAFMNQLNKCTTEYGNKETPGSQLINSEQVDESSTDKRPQQKIQWYSVRKTNITMQARRVQLINSEQTDQRSTIKKLPQKTPCKNTNFQKLNPNAKTTPVCKRTIIRQSIGTTPGYGNEQFSGLQFINSEQTNESSTDKRTQQRNPWYSVRKSTTIKQLSQSTRGYVNQKTLRVQSCNSEKDDKISTSKKPQRNTQWKNNNFQKQKSNAKSPVCKMSITQHQIWYTPGYGNQETSRTQLINSQQTDNSSSGSGNELQQKTPRRNIYFQKRRLNTEMKTVCDSVTLEQLTQRTSGYITPKLLGTQSIKSKPKVEISIDSNNDNKSQLQIPNQEPDVISKQSGCRSQNTLGTQLNKSKSNDKSCSDGDEKSKLQIQQSHLTKHEPIFNKQSECRTLGAQLIKEESKYLSQSTQGYGNQETPRTQLINSEQTVKNNSGNESQQKTPQKNIDLQKQILNTKMETVCASATVDQLTQRTSGYITPKLLGTQWSKSKPKVEISIDSNNDKKSQLQIPNQEPDVISKQSGCRSQNTLGTQLNKSKSNGSDGDDKSKLQIQQSHITKHEPIFSKQSECRTLGAQLIKEESKYLSQSTQGYGNQETPRTQLINSEQTVKNNSGNESQQKTPQKNIDLQKQILNTKMETVCASATVDQLTQRTSGYITPKLLGTQWSKLTPKLEIPIESNSDKKSQLQIANQEPDVIGKQLSCRSINTLGTQLNKLKPKDESCSDGNIKSQLQIPKQEPSFSDDKSELQSHPHLTKCEPDINTIVSKNPECMNPLGAHLIKEEANYESSDDHKYDKSKLQIHLITSDESEDKTPISDVAAIPRKRNSDKNDCDTRMLKQIKLEIEPSL